MLKWVLIQYFSFFIESNSIKIILNKTLEWEMFSPISSLHVYIYIYILNFVNKFYPWNKTYTILADWRHLYDCPRRCIFEFATSRRTQSVLNMYKIIERTFFKHIRISFIKQNYHYNLTVSLFITVPFTFLYFLISIFIAWNLTIFIYILFLINIVLIILYKKF